MTRNSERWICVGLFLLIPVIIYVLYNLGSGSRECEAETKSESIPSQETAPQRIGTLYTHQGRAMSGAIPIRNYTFPGGGFIEATTIDGRRVISNSCTIILEKNEG